MAATSLGTLMLNSSNWEAVNVFHNLTSKIPPSGNLDFFTPYSPLEDLNYSILRFNYRISRIDTTVGPALDYFFRPEIFSFHGICVYPISGQYGFLNRLLFYLLIIFALIARKRTWLAAAALGTAMTYAASAAVHAIALLVLYKYRAHSDPEQNLFIGDIDSLAILPILVTSSIMLTPILNWSTQVRENARAIAVFWGLLIFSALVPTFLAIWPSLLLVADDDQLFTCDIDVAKGCSLENIFDNSNYHSSNFYEKCGCNDTCGAASLPTPFRKGQNLQAYLVSDQAHSLGGNNATTKLYDINSVSICLITIQGLFSLLEMKFTQAQFRNKVFLLLAGGSSCGGWRFVLSKARFHLARLIASCFFLCAVMAAIVSPAVFISSIIVNEIITWNFPTSEYYDAVGQWSTWVGAAFVLVAAVIQNYHLAWWDSISLMIHRHFKWVRGGNKKGFHRVQSHETQNTTDSTVEVFRKAIDQVERPFKHARKSTSRSWKRVKEECEDFRLWWKDPILRSHKPHFRYPEKRSDMPPIEGLQLAQKSATMPPSRPNLSIQSPEQSFYRNSDSTSTPLLPFKNKQPPLQPEPYDPGLSEEAEMEQGTVHRSTYERRTSSFASSY